MNYTKLEIPKTSRYCTHLLDHPFPSHRKSYYFYILEDRKTLIQESLQEKNSGFQNFPYFYIFGRKKTLIY
jgi:hypothetical protein